MVWDMFSHRTAPGPIFYVRGSQFDFFIFFYLTVTAGSDTAPPVYCAQRLVLLMTAYCKVYVSRGPKLAYFSSLAPSCANLLTLHSVLIKHSWGAKCWHLRSGTGITALRQGEAQGTLTTSGLFTSSLNAATTCGSLPRLKPLQPAFPAKIFGEKWCCQRKARAIWPAQIFFPAGTPDCLVTSHLFPFTVRIVLSFLFMVLL